MSLTCIIGSRIKRLREARKYSQVELCEYIDLHQPDLSDIEAGKRLPNLKTLCDICRALDVSVARFFIGFKNTL